MPLIRLIYASVASPDIGYDDLMQIRRSARVYNEENGVHGILCFGKGFFLQALEGRRAIVNEIYHRIVTDPRHSQLQLLSCGPITRRTFEEWSMKLLTFDDAYTAKRREVALRHTGIASFDPSTMSARQASAFLRDLAALERTARGGMTITPVTDAANAAEQRRPASATR